MQPTWWMKAAILQLLSRMPGGRAIYRKLQDLVGSSKLRVSDYWPARHNLLKGFDVVGGSFSDAVVVEIGTGWHPVLPLIAYLCGARKVLSFDVNRWLTLDSLLQSLAAVLEVHSTIPDSLRPTDFATRLARIEHLLAHARRTGGSVESILSVLAIEYLSPGDASNTGLPDQTVDIVMHTDVFEHVDLQSLQQIISESARLLRPGGLHVFRVCPGDHFAEDKTITTGHFLQYSDRKWYWLGGSGLAYHNRLRWSEYVSLLEASSFEVLMAEPVIDQQVLEDLKGGRMKLAPEFRAYPDSVLACTNVTIYARLKGASRVN